MRAEGAMSVEYEIFTLSCARYICRLYVIRLAAWVEAGDHRLAGALGIRASLLLSSGLVWFIDRQRPDRIPPLKTS